MTLKPQAILLESSSFPQEIIGYYWFLSGSSGNRKENLATRRYKVGYQGIYKAIRPYTNIGVTRGKITFLIAILWLSPIPLPNLRVRKLSDELREKTYEKKVAL